MTDEKNILQFLTESLPKKLTEIYILEKILMVNRHNTILLLSLKESENRFVLKILEKDYYDDILSKSLNALTNQNLLLPSQIDFDTSYVYLLYPYRKTLSDVLLQKGLDYSMLYRLIDEIGSAIAILHEHNILHLDVTPDNIFLDEKNHFYLGDFSSSHLITKNLFPCFFHKRLYTGTTPAFAPQNKNHRSISFWNDQYSFSLLLYILLNNGNLPKKENTKNHSFFPSTNCILQKSMKPPSTVSKEMFSQLLSELKNSLQKDEEFFNCKNYQIQFMEADKIICKSFTPDCIMSKENKVKIQLRPFFNQLQVPIPLYGLLICCGFLFLFSFYHYMAKSTKNTSDSIKDYQLQTGSISSGTNEKETDASNTAPSILSDFPKETPFHSSGILSNTKQDHSENSTKETLDILTKDHILNISNSNYHDNSFLKSTIQVKSVQILFANSCQFTSSAPFSDFTNLKELYLYNNPLTSVTTLPKLKKLKTLVLSKCNLKDISCLAKIKALTILDLSQNKNLKGISSLSSLENLNYLIITHTNISQEDIRLLQKKLPHCTILS